MAFDICTARPKVVFDTDFCLEPVSKDARGSLYPLMTETQTCPKPECRTLKTVQALSVQLTSHSPCDRELNLDGTLIVTDLTTAFVDGDPFARGVHVGDFRWSFAAGMILGTLSGMTNGGTHRAPIFDPCQECSSTGYMEGRLCGQVRSTVPAFTGCEVVGTYRFRFEPTKTGGASAVVGTLEGVLVCECSGGL